VRFASLFYYVVCVILRSRQDVVSGTKYMYVCGMAWYGARPVAARPSATCSSILVCRFAGVIDLGFP